MRIAALSVDASCGEITLTTSPMGQQRLRGTLRTDCEGHICPPLLQMDCQQRLGVLDLDHSSLYRQTLFRSCVPFPTCLSRHEPGKGRVAMGCANGSQMFQRRYTAVCEKKSRKDCLDFASNPRRRAIPIRRSRNWRVWDGISDLTISAVALSDVS